MAGWVGGWPLRDEKGWACEGGGKLGTPCVSVSFCTAQTALSTALTICAAATHPPPLPSCHLWPVQYILNTPCPALSVQHHNPREALYYLDSVRRQARRVLFFALLLPWFQILFNVAWCSNDTGCGGKVRVCGVRGWAIWQKRVCVWGGGGLPWRATGQDRAGLLGVSAQVGSGGAAPAG